MTGNWKDHRRVRRAFSLIELLIVIAIMLTLGGLVVVSLLPAKEKADVDVTKIQMDDFKRALDLFRLQMDRYPTEEEGLAVLWSPDTLEDEEDEAKWSRFLETACPFDKWDNEWIYRAPSEIREGAPYDIISMGPDGEEDTDDDINNHHRFLDEEGEVMEEFEDFDTGEGEVGS
ncbi:MAG: type II secretion system major pseudopilin GspG [Phycisphaerales bacterium]|nr:MAG: type II secretion system major pseudopilin GspG [Phycisphaerales bacterium]